MDALATLWRRLRAEAERSAASPSERLLDDVLLLLNAPGSSEQRKKQVQMQAHESFGSEGVHPCTDPVSIFTVASGVGDAQV